MQLLTATDDFLTKDFGDQLFDLINMNPPWTKYGIQFINKAINLLKPNGKLVCVMGTEQLAPQSLKNTKDKGTFWDLLQRGSFVRFESWRVDGIWGCKPPLFPGTDNHCWFIWVKGETLKPFIFNNKTKDEFVYYPTGHEFRPPEIGFLNLDIYDWENGVRNRNTPVITGNIRFRWTKGKVVDMTHKDGSATEFIGVVDPIKTKAFLEEYLGIMTIYHSKRVTTNIAMPPIRKDLLI